jgi:hypothetical protein
MPYAVSSNGLVHAARCHLVDNDELFARREEALARGRRLALCCNEGLVAPAVFESRYF